VHTVQQFASPKLGADKGGMLTDARE